MKFPVCASICVLLLHVVTTDCVTYSTTTSIIETLANYYYNNGTSLTRIIPVDDLSTPIGLTLTMALYSIDKFDAVTGQVEITGSLFQEWTDKTQMSTIGDFNFTGIQEGYSVLISPLSIWTPTVVLLNAVNTIERVGDPAYKVRYQVSDGRAKWQPRTLLKAACTPDIRYYPFDRQECSFTYTAWGYTSDEVFLESAQSDWYMCDYTQNGVWTLIETKAEIEIKNGAQQLTFTFKIERRPLFFVINIVLPVLLLGFVNGFVFLMPPDCGERMGFSITCFLTLLFMLQTVLTFLPHAADPMSIFLFYMVVMMIMSIAVAIVTVIVLRIHHKKDSGRVPERLKKFIRIVTCVWAKPLVVKLLKKCKKDMVTEDMTDCSTTSVKDAAIAFDKERSTSTVRKRTMTPQPSTSTASSQNSEPIREGDDDDDSNEDHDVIVDIEWPDVSRILDSFFFVVFLAAQFVLAIIFMVPLATGGK